MKYAMALRSRWSLSMYYPMSYWYASPLCFIFLLKVMHWGPWLSLKDRVPLAVTTGGWVACTRKEKTRLSGPVGSWCSFILCNSIDAISIFKLHSLRGGLSLSVSLWFPFLSSSHLNLWRYYKSDELCVLCLLLMTVRYIFKLWCHEDGRPISRVRISSQVKL